MRVKENIFRAYDVRGVVGEELNEELYYALGRAYATTALDQDSGAIYSGYDGRTSSAAFAKALNAGMVASGADVVDIGMAPSPLVYFAALRNGGSGIVVTGSHNPPNYNGCKMMINGHTLETQWIQDLRGLIEAESYADGTGRLRQEDFFPAYVKAVENRARLARPLKVVIDAGNGVAGAFAPQVFRTLGCDVVELYCNVDGRFPNHHPDPSQPANMQDLCQAVRAHGADLGIGFDGDADRVGVVDNQGRLLFPDRVLMLLAEDALERNGGGTVIFDVKCSQHLGALVEKLGGTALMYKTGHSLIKKKIKEVDALIAGEMSGHLFVCEAWNGSDDAILVACVVAQILSKHEGKTLAQLFDAYPQSVSTPEINVTVGDDRKFAVVDQIKTQLRAQSPGARLIEIDGARIEFDEGWGLIRASNTTPALVVRIEAESRQALERIHAVLQKALSHVIPDARIALPRD